MELKYYVLICAKKAMSETEYPAVFLKIWCSIDSDKFDFFNSNWTIGSHINNETLK